MDYGAKSSLNVDLFTASHRISGVVNTRGRLLVDLLNDGTASVVELSKAFVSRLASPGQIVSSSSSTVLVRKSALLFAVLPVPEKPIIERNVYSMFNKHVYRVELTVGGFEISASMEALGKTDPTTLLTHAVDFLALNKAQAVSTSTLDPVPFQGEVMLVNKEHVGFLSFLKEE